MEYEDVFEEWSFYAKKRPLLARDMDLDALVKNSESKIIAITGFSRMLLSNFEFAAIALSCLYASSASGERTTFTNFIVQDPYLSRF